MSNHYEFGDLDGALYLLGPADDVEDADVEFDGEWALALMNASGDGLILDGDVLDAVRFVDLLHAHVHAVAQVPRPEDRQADVIAALTAMYEDARDTERWTTDGVSVEPDLRAEIEAKIVEQATQRRGR